MKAALTERGRRKVFAGSLSMGKWLLPFWWGWCVLFGGMGAVASEMDGHADVADPVVLGEEDLADRAEILRNQYRRMTPGDAPLAQDVGTWPAAWEEFSPVWDGAAAERDLGTWTVPVEVERDGSDTVLRDGNGVELWRGRTDFSKDGTEGVVLTGTLVAEEDWPLYRAARGEIARRLAASRKDEGGGMRGTNSAWTNGLRFTNAWEETNGNLHFEFAWETYGAVQVFCRAMPSTSWVETVVWTNDENEVVTNDFTQWRQTEEFNGTSDTWDLLGVSAVSNGVGEFTDSGFPEHLGRVRFYAAAGWVDTDGDGLADGEEWLVYHTNPSNADTDGDGLSDGAEIAAGTDPNEPDTDEDGLPDGWEVQNGLDPLEARGADGAEGDPDGDGFANALEYELGAPANNPAWNGAELAYKLTHAMPVVTTNSRSVTTNWVGLRVEVEDSWDCVDGGNSDIQDRVSTLAVPDLLACGYYVEVGIAGSVEDVDSGYDKVYFNAYTNTKYFASHDGIPDSLGPEAEECRMIGEHAVKTNLVLANSTVTLRYNTVGWRWHSGGYAQIVSAREVAPYAVEVEGPDFLCVGDTAQMTASGAGGGPYVWSVVGGAASIDANGVLTALSPGTAKVTASNTGGCAGTKEVCVGRLVGLGASCPQFGPSGSFGSNPEVFEGGETNFWHPDQPPPYWWFPGSYTNPASRVLKVFYKYIKNSDGNPGPCSIVLNAVMEPDDIPSNALTYAWTLIDGPTNSGAFDATDRKLVRFQNPTKGGLYKFQVDIGLPSGSNLLSGAWVLLPKAGGEIGEWLATEVSNSVQRAQAWTNLVVAVAQDYFVGNVSDFLETAWKQIATYDFDYQGIAGTPTPRYSFTDADRPSNHQPNAAIPGMAGQKGNGDWDEPSYATLKGIVVHRAKINNLMYAIWGRTLGYSETKLKFGSHFNAISRGLWDDSTTQNAIELGFDLYDAHLQGENLENILTKSRAAELQSQDNEDGLNDVNLWPDSVPISNTNSFHFPEMPTNYEWLIEYPANTNRGRLFQ